MPHLGLGLAEEAVDRALMPHILRKIDQKINWAKDGEFAGYIPANEAPADALQDLKTSENRLSVWRIEDDRQNLPQVLAAVASRRDNLQKLDYIILDFRYVHQNGLKMADRPGDTLDAEANSKWHLHLIELSASGLSRLANAMFAYGEIHRAMERELVEHLRRSVANGHIHESGLKPNVAASVHR